MKQPQPTMKNTVNTPGSRGNRVINVPAKRVLKWLGVCTSVALVACAGVSQSSPEETVKQRVNERWKTLVSGDFARSYAYTAPSFRGLISQDVYRGRIGGAVNWVAGEVATVECPEAIKCIARVRIDYKPLLRGRSGSTVSTYVNETWVLEDGQWWAFEPLRAN